VGGGADSQYRWCRKGLGLRNKLALVGTACFISGLLLLYLPYHSQGIIHDFAVNLFNGYVYSSASILSMGLSFAVFLSVFKLCLNY